MVSIKFVQPTGEEQMVEAQDGTVMEAAMANDIEGITAECGGAASCGTCHVHVQEDWFAQIAPPSAMEAEMLEFVVDQQPTSRLCCQIAVDPAIDGIVLTLPAAF